jgi:DNA repair protein RecO (recombination protein O)
MRVERQHAFVLHQREYSESSLLVELFTREHGRVGVIAKGARRPRSGRRGLLAPFQPLLVGWSGKGELGVLTGVEATGPAFELGGQAVYCGFYVNELVMRLVHRHDPHEDLFAVYDVCLRELGSDPDIERTLRKFEYRLLQELGYGLVLDRDVANNMPIDPGMLYRYVPDEGPHPVASAGRSPAETYVHGRTLLALAHGEFDDPDSVAELKGLMRALIAHRLDYKPLQSRRIFTGRSRLPAAGNNGDKE